MTRFVIAHPGWSKGSSGDFSDSTNWTALGTEAPFALAVLTTERNGVSLRPPFASKPIGHLTKNHAGPEMPFGDVVRVWHLPVGHEHEQVPAIGEHAFVQLASRLTHRDRRDDAIEPTIEVIMILLQRRVLQRVPSPPDGDGTQQ